MKTRWLIVAISLAVIAPVVEAQSTILTSKPALPDGYAGTAVCASCHADQYASYLATNHSRSLSLVDPNHKELAGRFDHHLSQTSFQATVNDTGIIHRASISVPMSPTTSVELPLGELPVKYVIGSGAFAKGYLLEDGEFLVQ